VPVISSPAGGPGDTRPSPGWTPMCLVCNSAKERGLWRRKRVPGANQETSPPTPTIATVSEGTHAAVLVLLFSVSAYCGTSYFRVAGGDSSREFSDAAPRLEPFGSVWRGDRWAGSDLPRRKIRSVWDEIDRLLARAQLHARACA
jgi:hypothetical protein